MKKLYTTLIFLFTLGFSVDSFAQSAAINAQATVFESLTVNADRNLGFGNIIAGASSEILPTGATSGLFSIVGQASTEVELTIAFPNPLVLVRDGAAETITLEIDNNFGIHSNLNDPEDASAVTFDPNTPPNVTLSGGGNKFIFLGGRVLTANNQVPGIYTAEITLTVDYTN